MNQPVGRHEKIKGFLNAKITAEFLRLDLPYFITNQALIKPLNSESAYLPDVLVIESSNLLNEPLWEKASTITQADSIPLVIEVVNHNWRIDYLTKVKDYEEIGVFEYWIVDYLALGGTPYIGNPKRPTVSIYQLIDSEYQVNQFSSNESIVSLAFPDLSLTANQIFQAGQSKLAGS
jgi:Uma2 family endonuclease